MAYGLRLSLSQDDLETETIDSVGDGTHGLCGEENDVATTSLLETWIEETQRRRWFLFEATRN